MSRNKRLEPLKTVIANINSDFGGENREFTVFYGNACEPLINGEMLHLKEEDYIGLLTRFLSKEECEYQIPTKSDIQNVSSEVAQKYKKGTYDNQFKNIVISKPSEKKHVKKQHKELIQKDDSNVLISKIEEQQELINQLKKQLDNSKEEEIYELTARISQLEKSAKKSSRMNLFLIVLFGILTFAMMYISFNKADAYLKEDDNVDLHAVVHREDGDEFVLVGTFKVENGELVSNE